jgi:hypothetical protein
VVSPACLPAGLGDTGNVAGKSQFTDLGASQTELTERAARTTGDFATVALARWVCVAGELLQAQAGCITLFVAALDIASAAFSSAYFLRTWLPVFRA